MKFLIEQVIPIRGKIYVLTKCLSEYSNFKLSDGSLLGGIEIEKWVDIPRSTDENGNQRLDNFAFVMKNEVDKYKVKKGEVVILSDRFVTTMESYYTVSGKKGVILACGAGELDIGTKLTENLLEWVVIENRLLNDAKFQKKLNDRFCYQYYLEAIGHDKIPIVGSQLTVHKNGS